MAGRSPLPLPGIPRRCGDRGNGTHRPDGAEPGAGFAVPGVPTRTRRTGGGPSPRRLRAPTFSPTITSYTTTTVLTRSFAVAADRVLMGLRDPFEVARVRMADM